MRMVLILLILQSSFAFGHSECRWPGTVSKSVAPPNDNASAEEMFEYAGYLYHLGRESEAIPKLRYIRFVEKLDQLKGSKSESDQLKYSKYVVRSDEFLERSKIFSSDIEKYTEIAAKKGDYKAQFCLSRVFEEGIVVGVSNIEAFAWAYVAHIQVSPRGDHDLESLSEKISQIQRVEGLGLGEQYLKAYTSVLERPSHIYLK